MLQVRLVEALIYEYENGSGHPCVCHWNKAWPSVPHLHIIHSRGRELRPLEQVLLAGHDKFPLATVVLLANDALPLPRADQHITVHIDTGPAIQAPAWISLHKLWPRRHLLPRRNKSPKPQARGIQQLLLLQHL